MGLSFMRTPEQATWDFVQQWLAKAQQDLAAARIILKEKFESYDLVGFHAQQSVEKFMKAILVRHQVEFPKTHNISILKDLIAKADEKLGQQLVPMETLTAYGVEYRYPGVYDSLSEEQGKEALKLSEQTRDLVLQALETYLQSGRPKGNT